MTELPTAPIEFLEPTFRRTAVIWWALAWRGVLLGVGAGFLVGFIEGAVGALVGASPVSIRYLTAVSGLIVGIAMGIYVVKLVLRKNYHEFMIRLVRVGSRASNR